MYFIRDHMKMFTAIVALLVIGAAACVWFFVINGEEAQSAYAREKANEPFEVTIEGVADKWDPATSTPLILHIEGTTKDGASTSVYHAMGATDSEDFVLEPGDYILSFVSPINADGSIYATPSATKVSKDTASDMRVELSLIPADSVGAEEADALVKSISEATAFGDETLSGAAGKTILNKAKSSIRNAPNVGALAGDAGNLVSDHAATAATSAPQTSDSSPATNSSGSANAQGQGQAASSTPTANANGQAQGTGANAGNNATSGSNGAANAGEKKSEWKETTYKNQGGKAVKLVRREDGTVYFERVEDDSVKVIDVAGHWE